MYLSGNSESHVTFCAYSICCKAISVLLIDQVGMTLIHIYRQRANFHFALYANMATCLFCLCILHQSCLTITAGAANCPILVYLLNFTSFGTAVVRLFAFQPVVPCHCSCWLYLCICLGTDLRNRCFERKYKKLIPETKVYLTCYLCSETCDADVGHIKT